MQAMQAAAIWPSAPLKPTRIKAQAHQSNHRLPCHKWTTDIALGFPKKQYRPMAAMVVESEGPGQGITRRYHEVA